MAGAVEVVVAEQRDGIFGEKVSVEIYEIFGKEVEDLGSFLGRD